MLLITKIIAFQIYLKTHTSDEKYQLFEELLSEDTEQMFVTPKDIDEIVDNLSKIIACGINMFCNVFKIVINITGPCFI